MTRLRLTNYFENELSLPDNPSFILADLPVALIPAALSALETRKGRSFWADTNEWDAGLDALNLFQVRLLMDATDRIVNEVRALRDGTTTPLPSRDPLADPYTLELTSLRDVNAQVSGQRLEIDAQLTAANETLQLILTAVQEGGSGEDVIERLDVLITLLGALA